MGKDATLEQNMRVTEETSKGKMIIKVKRYPKIYPFKDNDKKAEGV